MPTSSTAALATRRGTRHRSPQRGFTLIELMVTLAVVSILALVAAPAMTALVNGNRLAGATGELTASLRLARAEAIRRNARVTLCRSTNGTDCAVGTAWERWIIIDPSKPASSGDRVIREGAVPGSVEISGPANGIVFRPSGLISSDEQLTVCVPSTSPAENQRIVTVMISGNISTGKSGGGGNCP